MNTLWAQSKDSRKHTFRILFIASRFYPFFSGGTEIASYHLTEELSKRGNLVFIITSKRNKHLIERLPISSQVNLVKTTNIPILRGLIFILRLFLHTILLKDKIDLIHAQTVNMGFVAVIFTKIIKKPVLLWARGADVYNNYNSFFFRFVLKWLSKNKITIIALTQDLKRKMGKIISLSKIKVIPNGVNIHQEIDCSKTKLIKSLKILGNPSSIRLILYVGRLVNFKGLTYFLKALSHILANYPRTYFLLVGAGYQKQELLRLGRQQNILDHIRIIDNLPHTRILALMKCADIFVYPTLRGQGMSNAVLEAMATGMPVVATNVGGLPEIISNSKEGLLVPPKDEKSLATAIITLLSNRSLCKKFGLQATKTVFEKYGWSRVADMLMDAYVNLI